MPTHCAGIYCGDNIALVQVIALNFDINVHKLLVNTHK